MMIDSAVQVLFDIPMAVIENFSKICETVDWATPEMTRSSGVAAEYARTIRIPFGHRNKSHDITELTTQVAQVQDCFFNEIEPWIRHKFPNQILYKGEINYLYPSIAYPFHVDVCWFHEHSSRIHIPILTNNKSHWATEQQLIHMPVGSVYEVNNRIVHSFWNNGVTGRLHIVIDVMPVKTYQHAVKNNIEMSTYTMEPVLIPADVIIKRNQW